MQWLRFKLSTSTLRSGWWWYWSNSRCGESAAKIQLKRNGRQREDKHKLSAFFGVIARQSSEVSISFKLSASVCRYLSDFLTSVIRKRRCQIHRRESSRRNHAFCDYSRACSRGSIINTIASVTNNTISTAQVNPHGTEYTAILELSTTPSSRLTWEHRMKDWGSTAYEGLKTAIQGIYDCSGIFPPLQTTAGVLLTISKVVDVRAGALRVTCY